MENVGKARLPYASLAHWHPMSYRTHMAISAETLAAFTAYLETENTSNEPKELQPWIPFCVGKCAFCYFPVTCDSQIYDSYMKALEKSLLFFSERKYIKTSVFTELYVGGGSPSVLNENRLLTY